MQAESQSLGWLTARGGPLRYAAAGLVNSGAGYAVILALSAGGLHPMAANAGGFAAGLVVSFVIASAWTFGPAERPAAPARYAAAFLACYAANLAVVAGALAAGLPESSAQAGGVATYAGAFYLTCRWWVYGGVGTVRTDVAFARGLAARRPAVLLVSAAMPIALIAACLAPPPSDVVWQLWIARQLNAGADLYTDIVEVNPPLWFWMAMPVERVAGTIGLAPTLAMNLTVCAVGVSSLALCAAHTRGWPREARRARLVLLAAAALVLLVLPVTHYAQREHLALIGALPYALLAARRASGERVDIGAALATGALAAAGLALKPHFVLFPVLIEAWLASRARGLRGIVRAETALLGAAGLAYAAILSAFERDYLTEAVPLVRLAYGGWDLPRLHVLLAPTSAAAMVTALVSAALLRGEQGKTADAARALLLGWLAFVSVAVWQAKGFAYHLVPVTGFAGAAAALVLAGPARGSRAHPVLASLTVCACAMALLARPLTGTPERFAWDEAGAVHGEAILALTVVGGAPLAEAEARGLAWSSRSLGLWPLAAVASAPGSPRAEAVSARVADQVREDILCGRPDLLVTDDMLPFRFPAYGRTVLQTLAAEGNLAPLLAAYELAAQRGPYRIWRRAGALPEAPAACRAALL